VAIADKEKVVRTEMPLARANMIRVRPRPALPTTKPKRRKRIIPRIVRILGVNTPAKVPMLLFFESRVEFFESIFFIVKT